MRKNTNREERRRELRRLRELKYSLAQQRIFDQRHQEQFDLMAERFYEDNPWRLYSEQGDSVTNSSIERFVQEFDRDGYHKVTGYNIDGYDRNRYDIDGYDNEGYDIDGYDTSSAFSNEFKIYSSLILGKIYFN